MTTSIEWLKENFDGRRERSFILPMQDRTPPSSPSSNKPIIDLVPHDCGAGFTMGLVGGGLWYGVKGARNSPKGERLRGMWSSAKIRAPQMAGMYLLRLFLIVSPPPPPLQVNLDPCHSPPPLIDV
jgi:hypothetical protein